MPSVSLPVAILGAGALGLGGAALGAYGASSAGSTQANAAQAGINTQLGMYNQTRADLAPYNTAGQNALTTLSQLYGAGQPGGANAGTAQNLTDYITNLPGYQFQQQQGDLGINRAGAAAGTLQSGGTLKSLSQYNQGLAGTYYQNYINQLNQLSGLGESAASQTGNFATQTGANVANSQLAQGQAQAAGTVGSINALTGGIGNSLNNALTLYALNPGAYGNSAANANYYSPTTGAGSQ